MAEKFKTLVDMYETASRQYASKPHFAEKIQGQYQWSTYEQVATRVKNFRSGLAAKAIGKGDKVVIIANNSIGWAVAAHACYGLGACFVAMYEAQKPSEWAYIIHDCKAKAVIVSNETILNKFQTIKGDVPTVEHLIVIAGKHEGAEAMADLEAAGAQNIVPAIEPDPSDLAALIYTSGTTGKPKGVQLTHANIVSNINAVNEVFPMEVTDRSLSFLPWAHSFGSTVELHCMSSVGVSIGLAESTQTIIDNLPEIQPTILMSVPRIFNKIYAGVLTKMEASPAPIRALFHKGMDVANRRKAGESIGLLDSLLYKLANALVFSKVRARFGGRLKYAFSGGAAISKEVADFIDNLGIQVFEGYGLSETSPIATANYPNHRKIGSVGKAIPGVKIEIDTSVTEDDIDGEIIVHGPNIMKGYLNLEEATAAVIREDGGFRTGDMGHLDSDGFLYITGRIKEKYKLENGKYVVPAPLEEQYKLSPFINQIMIYGFNRPHNVAVVVPSEPDLTAWAQKNDLGGKSFPDLMSEPKVQELIQRELNERGQAFKNYERVRKCLLIHEEFTTDNEMLTPTLKLKRRNVLKNFQEQINKLYEA